MTKMWPAWRSPSELDVLLLVVVPCVPQAQQRDGAQTGEEDGGEHGHEYAECGRRETEGPLLGAVRARQLLEQVCTRRVQLRAMIGARHDLGRRRCIWRNDGTDDTDGTWQVCAW